MAKKRPATSPKGSSAKRKRPTTPQDPIKSLLRRIKKPKCEVGLKQFRGQKIPTVHQKLSIIEFYEGLPEKTLNKKNQKNYRSSEPYNELGTTYFSKLKETLTKNRLTGIVGSPGYGKTTISERLVKAWGKACFHLKCLEMNYGSREITLKQLLVDFQNPDFSDEDSQQLFDWIKTNQEKCLFDFDGMDQPSWKLEDFHPNSASYDTPQRVEQLMVNVLSGKFLPNAHISVTSRPHTFVTWPEKIRPEKFVLVGELSQSKMQKLFFAYSGKKAKELWSTLESSSPHLLDLCLIPIMLQLVILALLNSEDYSKIKTVTQVFEVLLKHLKRSEHVKNKEQIESIIPGISHLAYYATKNRTVVIPFQELEKLNLVNKKLSDADVQDLIIAIPSFEGFSQQLLEGDKNLVFTHQLFQEYYTAYHIKLYMDIKVFSEIVGEVVTDPHWAMVRRFLCGLLLSGDFEVPSSSDQQTQVSSDVDQPGSSSSPLSTTPEAPSNPTLTTTINNFNVTYMSRCITSHAQVGIAKVSHQNPVPGSSSRSSIPLQNSKKKAETFYFKLLDSYKESPTDFNLLADLHETNDATRKSFAKHFPAKFDFKGQNFSTNEVHAVARILQHVEQMEKLDLRKKSLPPGSTELIVNAIEKGKVKMKWLDLYDNTISNDVAKSLSSIVEYVEELDLERCKLSSESIAIICNAISEKKCKMKKLNLRGSTISNDEVKSLSSIVEFVEELDLGYCKLSSEPIAIICNAISEKKCKMKMLNLRGNTFSNDVAKLLSSIVEFVEELDLRYCKLSSESIAIICNAISEKKCKMKMLDLSYNTISNDVAKSLSNIVEYVERLVLQYCGLTKEGMEVIRSKLRELGLPMERVLGIF